MAINLKEMYLGRIKQINIDVKQAVIKKNWSELAKLKSENKRIEVILNDMDK